MEIPHSEVLAPNDLLDDLGEVDSTAAVVSVYGKAKDLNRLAEFPNLQTLWLSGLPEKNTHFVGVLASLSSLVVHDYRSPSLDPLGKLSSLESLAICGSPKLKSLSGVEGLAGLKQLILFDNCNYSELSAVSGLSQLEALCLEGGFSKSLRLLTLKPLSSLRELRRLRLASVRVLDKSLQPLHSLTSLREVFIAKTFSDTELRSLANALPNAKGEFLDTFREGAA